MTTKVPIVIGQLPRPGWSVSVVVKSPLVSQGLCMAHCGRHSAAPSIRLPLASRICAALSWKSST